MKKGFCGLLCLILLLGLTLPAGAEEERVEDAVGAAGAGGVTSGVYTDGLAFGPAVHQSRYDSYHLDLGIDVSEFQGEIDWARVAGDGVEFALVRIGGRFCQSGDFYEDKRWEYNVEQALAHGLEVGVYYFSQAIDEKEAREEAEETLRILGGYKDKLSLPVYLDVEYINNGGRLYDAQLSAEEQTDIALAYCEAIRQAGGEAGVYAAFLSFPILAQPLSEAGFSVWHAHWAPETELEDWYDIWQYSAVGQVDGIAENGQSLPVDLNWKYEPVPDSGFVDVMEGSWYYDAVCYVTQAGLFNGMGNFEFRPLSKMNREMFVTVLYRLAGEPEVEGESDFTDVTDPEAWYYKAVLWAAENSIVNGMGDGSFGLGRALSRQQMVTFLYRYARFAGLDTRIGEETGLDAFEDGASVQSWAAEAMLWAVDKGIITGVTEKTLEPAASTNRAQVAAVMQRLEEAAAEEILDPAEETELAEEESVPEEVSPGEENTQAGQDPPAEN